MKENQNYNDFSDISLCPIEPQYNEFLFKVFKESRPELNLINDISEEQKTNIILQQFTMEHQQLIQMYPNAELNIVMLNKEPVGRIYINYGQTSVRILEIGVLEQYRGLGIGKKILTRVIKEAEKNEKTVNLQVAWFNQSAYTFYERIGFKVVENNGVVSEMQYMP